MKLNCFCKHEVQDKKHGKGIRIFNKTTKGYRCTACGRDKS